MLRKRKSKSKLSFHTFLSNFPLNFPKEFVSQFVLNHYLSQQVTKSVSRGAHFISHHPQLSFTHILIQITPLPSSFPGPPSDLHSLHMLLPSCFHFFSFDHFLLWGWKKEVMFFVFILGCRKHKKSY